MTDIPISEQIAEARRELGLRYGVYKKRVLVGMMTQLEHDRQIALQKAIIASLERLKQSDEGGP